MKKKANSIRICVYTKTSYTRLFEMNGSDIVGINFDQLTSSEYDAFNKVEAAGNALLEKYPKATINWVLCPWDYDVNVVTTEQLGLGMNFPAIQIIGYYDGYTQRQYVLKNYPGGTRTFDKQDIYNHIRALYENEFGDGQQSIICKILPPLCNLGAYVWLGIVGVCAYKTMEVHSKPLKLLWGTGAVLAFESFAAGNKGKEIIDKVMGKKRITGIPCNCQNKVA